MRLPRKNRVVIVEATLVDEPDGQGAFIDVVEVRIAKTNGNGKQYTCRFPVEVDKPESPGMIIVDAINEVDSTPGHNESQGAA